MLKVDDEITGKVARIAFGGDGIIRKEGLVIFVPFTAPGDTISCLITEVKKNFARGRLLNILQPSTQRTVPLCPYYGACGGCQLQHINDAGQIEYKLQAVEEAMVRLGGQNQGCVQGAIPSPSPWSYRRHITLQLRPGATGFQAGYIGIDNRSFIPIQQCPIFQAGQDNVIPDVQALVAQMTAHPGATGKVTLFKRSTNQCLLLFHFKRLPPKAYEIIQASLPSLKAISGVMVSSPSGLISLGDTDCEFEIGGLRFEASPLAFLQNHPEQSLNIYRSIQEYISEGIVLDLYCGIGISSLLIAGKARQVVGVETNPAAIRFAEANALKNSIRNVHFICADVKEVLQRLLKEKNPSWVILNPPREGLEKTVAETLVKYGPEKILYISCMPSTLARDVKMFSQAGYKMKICQAFDMFPQTAHVETLVTLIR